MGGKEGQTWVHMLIPSCSSALRSCELFKLICRILVNQNFIAQNWDSSVVVDSFLFVGNQGAGSEQAVIIVHINTEQWTQRGSFYIYYLF